MPWSVPLQLVLAFPRQLAQLKLAHRAAHGLIFAADMAYPAAAATAVAAACVRNASERGVYGWYQAELPMKGEYKPDIGRTPMAAAEPTLQRVNQERGYEIRPEVRAGVGWWGCHWGGL